MSEVSIADRIKKPLLTMAATKTLVTSQASVKVL